MFKNHEYVNVKFVIILYIWLNFEVKWHNFQRNGFTQADKRKLWISWGILLIVASHNFATHLRHIFENKAILLDFQLKFLSFKLHFGYYLLLTFTFNNINAKNLFKSHDLHLYNSDHEIKVKSEDDIVSICLPKILIPF